MTPILCPRCSVDGRRYTMIEPGEIRTSFWACGCAVEPETVTPPADQVCSTRGCGALATFRAVSGTRRACGEHAPDLALFVGLARIAPPTWHATGHGAAAWGASRAIAVQKWREHLAEVQGATETFPAPSSDALDLFLDGAGTWANAPSAAEIVADLRELASKVGLPDEAHLTEASQRFLRDSLRSYVAAHMYRHVGPLDFLPVDFNQAPVLRYVQIKGTIRPNY